MATCTTCQTELVPSAHYCSRCGAPAATPIVDEATLRTDPSAVVDRAVRRGLPMRFLSALAGVIVASIFIVLMNRSSDQPDSATDDTVDNSTDDTANTAVSIDELVDDTPSDGVSLVSPAKASAIERSNPLRQDGSETGYRIIVSNGDRIVDVNLDTGQVEQFDGNVDVVGAVDGELIQFNPAVGFVAVPTGDLSSPGRVVFSIPEIAATESRVSVGSLHTAALRLPSTLIIEFDPTINSPRQENVLVFEVDLRTGRFSAVELESARDLPPISRSQFGLVWLAGGGLFDIADGTYRKLSSGYPLLLGVSHAIVQVCDAPGSCVSQWIDRATGGPIVDRSLPDLQGAWWITEIDEAATMLWIDGPDGSRLYDVNRGRFLPEFLSEASGAESRFRDLSFALSPDRRWLARVRDGEIAVYDLVDEADYAIDIGQSPAGSSLFFVPTS